MCALTFCTMNHKEIKNHLGKIRNIGHKHVEMQEWINCILCSEANQRALTEQIKLKRLFPKDYAKYENRFKYQKPINDVIDITR